MHFSFNLKWAKLREGKLLGSRSIKWKSNRQNTALKMYGKIEVVKLGKRNRSGVNIDFFLEKNLF